MVYPGFIGPSAPSRSPNVNSERTMNLYLENGSGSPKTRPVLYGSPGTSLFTTLPTTPVRGIWANSSRLFAVAGARLYEVFSNGTYTDRGSVGNDGFPVQFFPNGNQLLVVSNGTAFCDSGAGPVQCAFSSGLTGTVDIVFQSGHSVVNWVSGDQFSPSLSGATIVINGVSYTVNTSFQVTPTQLHLTTAPGGTIDPVAYTCTPILQALTGTLLDGYFIVAPPASRQINISSINDGTTWAAIDFGVKEGYPDYIESILADHEELWLFGTDTTEVWQDTGAASFPFSRIPGAFIHHGCVSPNCPVRLREGVAWLTSDPARGSIRALMAQGFVPAVISTPEAETAWDSYSTVSDAVSFTYIENGHEFWIISFPTANATWCYDATENTWTQRGWWNGATNDRQRQMFHAFVFGKHIVGDWQNGKLYYQSTAYLDDAGTAIHWERTAPHLTGDLKRVFYSQFQLDVEVGTSASLPSISLSWSDDGGHTFNTPRAATPSQANYAARVIWRMLGMSRDRVYRVTGVSGSGVRVALLSSLIEFVPGDS